MAVNKPVPAPTPVGRMPASSTSHFHIAFVIARLFALLFYFMQYAVRSAPSVMLPELKTDWRPGRLHRYQGVFVRRAYGIGEKSNSLPLFYNNQEIRN